MKLQVFDRFSSVIITIGLIPQPNFQILMRKLLDVGGTDVFSRFYFTWCDYDYDYVENIIIMYPLNPGSA